MDIEMILFQKEDKTHEKDINVHRRYPAGAAVRGAFAGIAYFAYPNELRLCC